MDNYYTIEVRLASKNGYFLPSEAKSYYGHYGRLGYCVHWWGDGTGASNHDNIVNYMNAQAAAGIKSANYVGSDNKITLCVGPDNAAWCQESGNATEISVETQPTLGAEGYKKHGWLHRQLCQRYSRELVIHGHNFWFQTACPGTISLDRIAQESDKWNRGVYTAPVPAPAPAPVPQPVPAPTPAPATADLEWVQFPKVQTYKCVTQPTSLWNFNQTSWSGFKVPVKQFNAGDKVDIYGYVTNHTIKATYLLTEYSFTKKITSGINVKDLTLVEQPVPLPTPAPTPVLADQPEWVKNLRDIDDTTFWFAQDQELIDITTGKPTGTKSFKKDESFVASALTAAKGVEYRITEYSFKGSIFNGVPTSSLTLTPPGVPDIAPVPSVEQRLSTLEKLVAAIIAALAKININIKI